MKRENVDFVGFFELETELKVKVKVCVNERLSFQRETI